MIKYELTTLIQECIRENEIIFECIGRNQFKLKSYNQLLLEDMIMESGGLRNFCRKAILTGVMLLSLSRALGADISDTKKWEDLNPQEQQKIAQTLAGGDMAAGKDFYEGEQMLKQTASLSKAITGLTSTISTNTSSNLDKNNKSYAKFIESQFKKHGQLSFKNITQKEQEEWNKSGGEDAYNRFMLDSFNVNNMDKTMKIVDAKLKEMAESSKKFEAMFGKYMPSNQASTNTASTSQLSTNTTSTK